MDTREKIILTAINLFNQEGFHVPNLASIAHKCDMSRGNLAYHFKQKENILDAIAQLMQQDIDEKQKARKGYPAFSNLRLDIHTYGLLQEKYPFVFRDMSIFECGTIKEVMTTFAEETIKRNLEAFSFAVEIGNMKQEPYPGLYHQLAVNSWIVTYYWIAQKQIRKVDAAEEAEKIIWSTIRPYFTQKGLDAFERYFGKGFPSTDTLSLERFITNQHFLTKKKQMHESYFTEEHNLFREGLRAFLQKEVIPHLDKWEEEGTIPRDIWTKFGEMGYLGIYCPEEYGGLDLDIFYTVILLEELQRINSGGFAAAIWAHCYLAMSHLKAEGSEAIKSKYLTRSALGELIGCLCISEPFGGSDVAAMRTTAVLDGDEYVLNGSKTFITNGVYSDYLVVVSKMNVNENPKSMGVFLVDRATPGVSASKLDKLGWRASDTGEIAFDNVRIPVSNLMGEPGNGFYYVMQHFAIERLIMGLNAHARAEYALEYTLQYMSERSAFGQTLDRFQALRHRIAEMAADVEIIKTFNYQVAQQINQGKYPVKEACMSKLKATAIADDVIYSCLQFLGGYGYMEEYPLARMFRDSRLGPIGGGTSEIMKEIIAKTIIDQKEYKTKI